MGFVIRRQQLSFENPGVVISDCVGSYGNEVSNTRFTVAYLLL